MKKGIVVGKEVRTYEKDGQLKTARTLYVMWDAPNQPVEGMSGCYVEAIYMGKILTDNIPVGAYCGFEYDIMPGRNGMIARLASVTVFGVAEIMIELPKQA